MGSPTATCPDQKAAWLMTCYHSKHISTAYLLMICTTWRPAGKLCFSLALVVNLLQHAQMDVGHCQNPSPLGACLCGKQYSCLERLVSKPFACKSMTVSKLYCTYVRQEKKKFALCSDHTGGLLKRQLGACINSSMQSKVLGSSYFVNGRQMMIDCSSVTVPFGLWRHRVFPRVFAPFAFHQTQLSILEAVLTALAGAGARLPCRR